MGALMTSYSVVTFGVYYCYCFMLFVSFLVVFLVARAFVCRFMMWMLISCKIKAFCETRWFYFDKLTVLGWYHWSNGGKWNDAIKNEWKVSISCKVFYKKSRKFVRFNQAAPQLDVLSEVTLVRESLHGIFRLKSKPLKSLRCH